MARNLGNLKHNNIDPCDVSQDLRILQKVKNAKNQKSSHKIAEQLPSALQKQLDVFSTNDIKSKIKMALSKNDFRPLNLPFYSFSFSQDLPYIQGQFSTFDEKLSSMVKRNVKAQKIRDYIKENIDNLGEITEKYISDIDFILKKHYQLSKKALNCTDKDINNSYKKLLQVLVDDLCTINGLKEHFDVYVIDDWKKAPSYVRIPKGVNVYASTNFVYEGYNPKPKAELYFNQKLIYNDLANDNKNFFNSIISIMAHEFGHLLDFYAPNKGVLGCQIQSVNADVARAPVLNKMDAYLSTPTEVSSLQIEKAVFEHLEKQR